MAYGFTIVRKVDDGKELYIAWLRKRESAEELLKDLKELWPAEYKMHEAAGPPMFRMTPIAQRWTR